MIINKTNKPDGATHLYAHPDLMDESGTPKHYWQWERHESGKVEFWTGSKWERTYSVIQTNKLVGV